MFKMGVQFMTCGQCRGTLPEREFDYAGDAIARKTICKRCCANPKPITKPRPVRHRKKGTPIMGVTYRERDEALKAIKFESYSKYLGSKLWKRIRGKVFRRKGKDCYLCGKPATELHHNRYHKNDLKGKTLTYIYPICAQCHVKVEFTDGKKNMFFEVARKFDTLRAAFVEKIKSE